MPSQKPRCCFHWLTRTVESSFQRKTFSGRYRTTFERAVRFGVTPRLHGRFELATLVSVTMPVNLQDDLADQIDEVERINESANELNREAEDVLEYQIIP